MTKTELADKIKNFLAAEDDSVHNEWYCTQAELSTDVLERFAEYINVNIDIKY